MRFYGALCIGKGGMCNISFFQHRFSKAQSFPFCKKGLKGKTRKFSRERKKLFRKLFFMLLEYLANEEKNILLFFEQELPQ